MRRAASGLPSRARLLRQAPQCLRVGGEEGNASGQHGAAQLRLGDHLGRTGRNQAPRVQALVIVRRVRERNEDGRLAEGGDFGHGGGARPADDQVGPAVLGGHVVIKGLHAAGDARAAVGLARHGLVRGPGLVHEVKAFPGAEVVQGLGHRHVDAVGALAAADDQDRERFPAGRGGVPARFGGGLHDLPAQGVARPHDLARVETAAGPLESGVDAVGAAAPGRGWRCRAACSARTGPRAAAAARPP